MRIAWATDLHLDHAGDHGREKFADEVIAQNSTALLITGDISSSKTVEFHLHELQKRIGIAIYYVLGNHDYYRGSIFQVRDFAKNINLGNDPILWMPHLGVLRMTNEIGIVGIDGWGDGRLGNFASSKVRLNDWNYIKEFQYVGAMSDRSARLRLLNNLGMEEAETLRPNLDKALGLYDHVIVMTHVPPWREATWHEGGHCEDNWLPWFSCKAAGDVIVELAVEHPGKKVTVLCGHTHGKGHSTINDQVDVHTGGSRYYHPTVAGVIVIENGIMRVEVNQDNLSE